MKIAVTNLILVAKESSICINIFFSLVCVCLFVSSWPQLFEFVDTLRQQSEWIFYADGYYCIASNSCVFYVYCICECKSFAYGLLATVRNRFDTKINIFHLRHVGIQSDLFNTARTHTQWKRVLKTDFRIYITRWYTLKFKTTWKYPT